MQSVSVWKFPSCALAHVKSDVHLKNAPGGVGGGGGGAQLAPQLSYEVNAPDASGMQVPVAESHLYCLVTPPHASGVLNSNSRRHW